MHASASIDHLSEVLADDGLFPARMGHKDPSSPSFVFFDDENEISSEEKAFRDDIIGFEEWVAAQNHRASGESIHKPIRKDRLAGYRVVTYLPHCPINAREMTRHTPKKDGRKTFFHRASYHRVMGENLLFIEVSEPIVVSVIEDMPEDYVPTSTEEPVFEVCTYENLKTLVDNRHNQKYPRYDEKGVLINPFLEIEPVITDRTKVTYSALQEIQERNNWLVNFYKNQPRTNDRWHRIIKGLGAAMSDEDMELAVNPIREFKMVLNAGFKLKEEAPEESPIPGVVVNPLPVRPRYAKIGVKYAPGPIGGTKFVNQTLKNVQKTNGTDPVRAKLGYAKNHGLTDEFVSVDRVQYEGEKESHYVVGRRKTSDTTPSNYYDPEPAWKDHEGGTYAPRACALFVIPKSRVMPPDSHRLTVREFERALVAGAECFDNADEAFAGALESDYSMEGGSYFEESDHDTLDTERIYDGRVSLMNYGYGGKGRDRSSFTDEEDYLYGILRMIEDVQGQELLTLMDQDVNMLHRHMMADGTYDRVVSILKFVQKDNPEMLEFVTKAICGDESIHEDLKVIDMEAVPPLWETDYSIPVGENGACRLASWINWA